VNKNGVESAIQILERIADVDFQMRMLGNPRRTMEMENGLGFF